MKFEIYKDAAGEFRFRIIAANGNILASSQGYNQKQSAKDAIASIQKSAADAAIVDNA
ncbi:YegP family protein [Demequina sp.]|uniref:YegP family protein n=1 Tax=Demequina sp. TaxID=2050685 RepID=UPI003D0FE000